MKKIFVTLAAIVLAAGVSFAQDMSKATETAKLANEALTTGDYATAISGFKEALKMAEACGDDGLELVGTCKSAIAKVSNAIAKKALTDKNYDEAVAKYNETIAIAKEYGETEIAEKAEALIPQIYMQKAGSLLNAKDFAAAAEAYGKVLELDPTNGQAALRQGMSYENAGNAEAAIAAFTKAAENGQEKAATAQLGKHYLKEAAADLKAKNYTGAVEAALKSNEYAANPQTLQIAGQASQLAGKNENAIKYFEQYLEAAPDAKNAGQIAYTVGALYQTAKNNAKAKEFYQKAVSDPKYGAEAQKMIATLK